MPTVYNWAPLFDAINNATNQWGQRNQVNSMINSLSGTPAQPGIPAQNMGSQQISQPGGGTSMLPNTTPQVPGLPATPGPLSGVDPRVLQMMRSAPPNVSLPLLLQLGTRQNEYDTTPRPGINPTTGLPDQFVTSKNGGQKWLGISQPRKVTFVNGQAVDENTPLGTIIPQQVTPPEIVRTAERLFPGNIPAQNSYIKANSAAAVKAIETPKQPNPNAPIPIPHPSAGY